MRIKVLVDNKSDYSLFKPEWGLSVLFEHNKNNVLLDFGQSNKFINNAYHLDCDISSIDFAVLSHAHYDHSNGMKYFIKNNNYAKIYMHESAKNLCFRDAKSLGIKYKKYIGIHKGYLDKYNDRICYVKKKSEIARGIYILPYSNEITLNHDDTLVTKHMYIREYNDSNKTYDKKYIPDTFNHEVTLVFDTKEGLVIANSCSHMGVINIINEVRKAFPKKHIYAYVGGLHLFNAKEDDIKKVADVLLKEDIDYVITGHCTKDRAYNILEGILGERMRQMESGYEIEI